MEHTLVLIISHNPRGYMIIDIVRHALEIIEKNYGIKIDLKTYYLPENSKSSEKIVIENISYELNDIPSIRDLIDIILMSLVPRNTESLHINEIHAGNNYRMGIPSTV